MGLAGSGSSGLADLRLGTGVLDGEDGLPGDWVSTTAAVYPATQPHTCLPVTQTLVHTRVCTATATTHLRG